MKKPVLNLSGAWDVRLKDGRAFSARLPGTLDTNRIGDPDRPEKQWNGTTGAITTRFTRKYTYTGPALFERTVTLDEIPDTGRMILTAERSRALALEVNGEKAESVLPGTLSTPYVFESAAWQKGENRIVLTSDNSYPDWPADAILMSSAATDETQTNWNGILGKITLEQKPVIFLANVMLGAGTKKNTARVRAFVSLPSGLQGETQAALTVTCGALQESYYIGAVLHDGGVQTITADEIPLRKDTRRWNPEDPYRYSFRAELTVRTPDGAMDTDAFTGKAGFRTFGEDREHRLCINGRRFFLRGEVNCAVYPETGCPPTTVREWKRIIRQYQAYGINCLRFHSHCPPEAAFEAADETGMLMQPELSHWDYETAFESNVSFRYYREELRQILRQLGGHPSFVMLSLGNELACGKTGEKRMGELVEEAKILLPDRLYIRGSNAFYGAKGCDQKSGFYTAQNYENYRMRAISAGMDSTRPEEKIPVQGYLNNTPPSSTTDFRKGMAALRQQCKKPMFSFEVGQYEVLPDFRELRMFRGVTVPENYRIIRRKAKEKGLLPVWEQMVEASGELSLICYREEAEAVMRTPEMSGICLLGIQDFPGQGTAIVGMMNAHLKPKPYPFARPERFRAFFRDALPLIRVEKYTWYGGETMRVAVQGFNCSPADLRGTLACVLKDGERRTIAAQTAEQFAAKAGTSDVSAVFTFRLPEGGEPCAATVEAYLEGQEETFRNEIRIWIYPEKEFIPADGTHCCESLDAAALRVLENGGKVLLEPKSEEAALPGSMRGQFSTDFWSVGTFPQQEGGMGLLIDDKHPVFRRFPTSFHTDYQWWRMAGQRAMRLPGESCAGGIIVRQMDSCLRLDTFAMLAEATVGAGKILISSMGLKELPQAPEVTALRNAIIRYMQSEDFRPKADWPPETIRMFIR